jgi:hypothetical protein
LIDQRLVDSHESFSFSHGRLHSYLYSSGATVIAEFVSFIFDHSCPGIHTELLGKTLVFGCRPLAQPKFFAAWLRPLFRKDWIVYSKPPFGGPEYVLQYLGRYTHRVAISNRRLISADDKAVTFKWKDYRIEGGDRYKTMTLATHEFIRRFLIHVLPKGLHRIRHYGLFANGERAKSIDRARELLAAPASPDQPANTQTADASESQTLSRPCPCCGGRMIIIETFERGSAPRYHPATPASAIAIDTS